MTGARLSWQLAQLHGWCFGKWRIYALIRKYVGGVGGGEEYVCKRAASQVTQWVAVIRWRICPAVETVPRGKPQAPSGVF